MPPLPERRNEDQSRPPIDTAPLRRFDEWLAATGLPEGEAEARRRALTRALTLGMPGAKDEAWRTMDLKGLTIADFLPGPAPAKPGPTAIPEGTQDSDLIFIDGRILHVSERAGRMHIHDLADPVPAARVSDGRESGADDVFRLLNRAASTHGFALELDAGEEAPPMRVRDLARGLGAHARHRLSLARGAKGRVVIEEEAAAGLVRNGIIDVALARGARLDLVLIQRTGTGAHHLLRLFAGLAAGARLTVRHLVLGRGAARAEQVWTLDGAEAHGDLAGLMLAPAPAHLDLAVEIAHRSGAATSDQHLRAIAAPAARAAAAGRILVAPGADATEAHQQLRGLLLASGAECDFKPELEIHAEEVVCSHGAAIGSLDETQLFYLMSRGLDARTARRVLMEAFATERLLTIDGDDPARAWIDRAIAEGMDMLVTEEASDG